MLLKIGSTGEDVKKVQEKLGLPINGTFDAVTSESVKKWQALNGLKDDGVIGDFTWTKMFGFKLEKLKGYIPDSVISQINDTASKFGITNVLRLAHFLSQCSHESGNYKAVTENLNYTSDGLKKIFPKYFPGNLSDLYARKPEKIANRVYSSRMANGDEASGDGYKYRGRGYIQLTGKANYASFDKFVTEDILSNPELVATKYPLASAAFFFNSNNLWSICDKGADDATVTALTKRVNGGTLGLAERIENFHKIYKLLTT
jgi:putative chitinase